MFRIKRLLPLLFSLVLLFCSVLPVQAQTVSSGDALYANEFVSPQMLSLSAESGISTVSNDGLMLLADYSSTPYDIGSIEKAISFNISAYESKSTISIPLKAFDVGLDQNHSYSFTLHNEWDIYCYTGNARILGYDVWILHNGQKNIVGTGNWSTFKLSDNIYGGITLGVDVHYKSSYLYEEGSSYSGYSKTLTDGYYDYYQLQINPQSADVNQTACTITVKSPVNELYVYDQGVSFTYSMKTGISNIFDRLGDINNYSILINSHLGLIYERLLGMWSDIISGFNNVVDKLEDVRISLWNQIEALRVSLWNKIDEFRIQVFDNFTTLFEKMDEDQEELINGYDPGTGSAAKNEFDSSAAQLEAAEGNLFGQTSYDQVDYQQFNSFFSIEAVAASMLFVKAILESLYGALGVFGVPLTIGLVLLVFTRIIGFQNFYSGGD